LDCLTIEDETYRLSRNVGKDFFMFCWPCILLWS